jgi:hypothetical protein
MHHSDIGNSTFTLNLVESSSRKTLAGLHQPKNTECVRQLEMYSFYVASHQHSADMIKWIVYMG